MNEQALKSRLKFIAQEQNRSFQEIWKLFLLERFLVRLSHSPYYEQLVFKGGLLLSYYLAIGRETTDIDLLAESFQATSTQVERTLREICDIQINDNLLMSFSVIEELEHTHMNYPGYRVTLDAQYGKMNDRIQIDIGVGDAVEPVQIQWRLFQYKEQPLFEENILLNVYPVETIFSEKLETIISRGAANSRMKDFHDIWLLCRQATLINKVKLKDSFIKTCVTRGTKATFPIGFSEGEYIRLQGFWSAHLRTLGETVIKTLELPADIYNLVQGINAWIEDILLET